MPNVREVPLIDLGPFKGIDNYTSAYFLDPKRATDIVNYIPELKLGSLVSVLGRTALQTMPSAVLGLTRFDRTGLASRYIAAANQAGGAAGVWQFAVGVAPALIAYPSNVSPTATQPSYFAPSQKWLFMVNGIDPMVKIDPNLVMTLAQAAAPTVSPTVALNGAGVLNAIVPYFWRFTFSNTDIETGPGPISAALSPVNQQVLVTGIPAAAPDPQLTTTNIYRLGGTLSVWKLAGSVAFGAASFADNVADTALGAAMVLVRDQPPVGAWYLASHKERLFTFGTPSDPVGLYNSNNKEPWGWDRLTQYRSIGKSSVNDFAQGMASLGSILMLFKQFSTWALFGDDPTSFVHRKLYDISCAAPRSITAALGVVFWVALDGAWMFDGRTPTRISTNIQTTILGLAMADIQRATGFYRSGIWYLSFPAQGVTYAYHIAMQEWYKLGWAAETAYFNATTEIMIGSRAGLGNVDTWFAASTDLGLAIAGSFVGKIDDSGKPAAQKTCRYIVLIAPIQASQTAVLTLVYDPGVNQTSVTRTLDLSAYPIRKIVSLPPPQKEFQCQLTITTSSTVQIEIQRLQVWGWAEREFTVRA